MSLKPFFPPQMLQQNKLESLCTTALCITYIS
jgi:hypothetical protein